MNITWEYAVNFESNEQRWIEMENNLKMLCMMFAKNTILQITFMSNYMELLEVTSAILNGERGDYLYNKAKEFVDETARLENVAKVLTEAYRLLAFYWMMMYNSATNERRRQLKLGRLTYDQNEVYEKVQRECMFKTNQYLKLSKL